ncbi:MAG: hypothetical protein JW828_16545 [Sedimentisphaerales bacterium]|nr:hypothetical protein [Sedimentisphaerales bacterium]
MYIARLFIFKLKTHVAEPYISGKFLGITQQLDEIPAREFWPKHRLPSLPDEDLMAAIYNGCRIGDLLEQIIKRQNSVKLLAFRWLTLLSVLIVIIILWKPVIIRLSQWEWLIKHVGEALAQLFIAVTIFIFSSIGAFLFGRFIIPWVKKLRGKK